MEFIKLLHHFTRFIDWCSLLSIYSEKVIIRIYSTKNFKLHVTRIILTHSLDGDTYFCMWSNKYRPLANACIYNSHQFVLCLIPHYLQIFPNY